MDIDARIRRRQRRNGERPLVRDYDSISPVAHVDEPTDRGPVLEQILDHLDPVFDGAVPSNAYLHGPAGSGKSAVVTALFSGLARLSTHRSGVIHTSTRAGEPTVPGFATVDARRTTSEFNFYHAVLDELVDESIPEHGISTDELEARLHDVLDRRVSGVVVSVDHVGEPNTTSEAELVRLFADLPDTVSWLAIGRRSPSQSDLIGHVETSIAVEAYRRQTLVDILMTRASSGFTQQALDHELARRIADWADGNAHDALAVLCIAGTLAEAAERSRVTADDVESAIAQIPPSSVSLGRVLSLPENRQVVLRALVDLGPTERESVSATTTAISSDRNIDLSPGTVKRFLYEMAEIGIVERVQSAEQNGRGRPPSRVELRFPPTAFRVLHDRARGDQRPPN